MQEVQDCFTNAWKLAKTLYLRNPELSLSKIPSPGVYGRGAVVFLRVRQMIVGTGVDITEVARIKAAVDRFGERFLKRVFTPAEISYSTSKGNVAERLAARFAAKEAGMKAIGTGLRHGVTWQNVEVVRQPGGRPGLRFTGKAADFAVSLGCKRIHLSLSHTEEHAIAHVILEGE